METESQGITLCGKTKKFPCAESVGKTMSRGSGSIWNELTSPSLPRETWASGKAHERTALQLLASGSRGVWVLVSPATSSNCVQLLSFSEYFSGERLDWVKQILKETHHPTASDLWGWKWDLRITCVGHTTGFIKNVGSKFHSRPTDSEFSEKQ